MKLELVRVLDNGEATFGMMVGENKQPLCLVLEKPWLNNEKKVSCIPEGEYDLVKDSTGKHKFLKILNAPGRTDIEIHPANRVSELKGCLAPGFAWGSVPNSIEYSVAACERLVRMVGNNVAKLKIVKYERK